MAPSGPLGPGTPGSPGIRGQDSTSAGGPGSPEITITACVRDSHLTHKLLLPSPARWTADTTPKNQRSITQHQLCEGGDSVHCGAEKLLESTVLNT